MKCARCDSNKTRVVDSREGVDGRSVRRRRECESCEFRYTTFERLEESLPMVVKKGGQRESFDRYKILSGMKKACEKRPVSVIDLEESVKLIEANLLEAGEKEVSSEVIGSMVAQALQSLDQVAYVRFASVYREFSDVSEFMDTLESLALNPPNARTPNAGNDKGAESGVAGIDSIPSAVSQQVNFESTSKVSPINKNARVLRSGQQLTLIEK